MKNLLTFLALILIAGTFTSCVKEDITPTTEIADESNIHARGGDGEVISPADLDVLLGTSVLIAGQNHEAGTVHVGISGGSTGDPADHSLTIILDVTNTDWIVGTTHIFAGGYGSIPLNGGGNPQIGQFPYGTGDVDINTVVDGINGGGGGTGGSGGYTGYTVINIPLDDVDFYTSEDGTQTCITVMVHAEVYETTGTAGSDTDPLTATNSETAWGSGSPIQAGGNGNGNGNGNGGNGGGSWATYQEICW